MPKGIGNKITNFEKKHGLPKSALLLKQSRNKSDKRVGYTEEQLEAKIKRERLNDAAPDMYEALKALVNHFRINDEGYFQSDLCTDAIVALAKAEGKPC